ncbi:glycosyltransferase family 8 protein [Pontibacter pamirensis]|uniref:glycosyltransferase family 8 protein n=1 Tax=Pontibacter pamirensis TaxID=2562824 RepID=UPI001389F3BA|nr:glycosyltransferase [Pontibacter pamirensis]
MNIAFCINHFGMIGLGTTVLSLLRNCSHPEKLVLCFLCAELSDDDKMQINKLLLRKSFEGTFKLIEFDPVSHFGSLNSLHGDWTTYGRLLLPDFIEAEQVLYLDSDLVLELDVLELSNFDFKGNAIAAVGGGKFKYALGSDFYIGKAKIMPDVEYFNARVLLMDLTMWRYSKIKERCLEIANLYPLELPSHDQSILNIFCLGKFAKLPMSFNCAWLSYESKPNNSDNMILHFVGSPKSWDTLGQLIHNGYQTWMKYTDQEWLDYFNPIIINSLHRMWKLRRSYTRCIINKLLN